MSKLTDYIVNNINKRLKEDLNLPKEEIDAFNKLKEELLNCDGDD